MKYLAITTCLLLLFNSAKAQTDSANYPVVIEFASFCCGVPDSKPIIDYVKCFKKKNKTESITGYKLGPAGREGEYYLVFPLTELTQKQREKFVAEIECIKVLPGDRGGYNFHKQFDVDSSRFQRPLFRDDNKIKI